jgi:predicted MFS family arabinose efflux permease
MGLLVSNMYFFQPLTPSIADDMGWSLSQANALNISCQVGVALGLFFVVPLGDRLASRSLVLTMVGLIVTSLTLIAIASSWAILLALCLILGIGLCGGQIMSPFIASLSAPTERGRTFGTLIAGGMMAVTLSRPVATTIASIGTWKTVFVVSAACMSLAFWAIYRILPRVTTEPHGSYLQFVGSQFRLWHYVPLLRRRALCQGFMVASLSGLWSVVPAFLVSGAVGLDAGQMAAFTVAAIFGAIAAPLAGRLTDSGRSAAGIRISLWLAVIATGLAVLAGVDSNLTVRITLLLIAAALLDFSVALHLVLSQQAVFESMPQARSRLNSLFMGTFFIGGALGSWAVMEVFTRHGWSLAALVIMGFAVSAIVLQEFYAGQGEIALAQLGHRPETPPTNSHKQEKE